MTTAQKTKKLTMAYQISHYFVKGVSVEKRLPIRRWNQTFYTNPSAWPTQSRDVIFLR